MNAKTYVFIDKGFPTGHYLQARWEVNPNGVGTLEIAADVETMGDLAERMLNAARVAQESGERSTQRARIDDNIMIRFDCREVKLLDPQEEGPQDEEQAVDGGEGSAQSRSTLDSSKPWNPQE